MGQRKKTLLRYTDRQHSALCCGLRSGAVTLDACLRERGRWTGSMLGVSGERAS